MKRSPLLSLVVLPLLLVACGKSSPSGPAAGDTPAPEAKPIAPPAKPASATPWTFDGAAIQAKLQGIWVIQNASCLGCKEAWKVEGDKVAVFHEGKEDNMTLKVLSPCSLQITKKNPDGSSEGSVSHFALEGDTLHLGLGDAGVKTADGVVACMSNGVYVLKAGVCKFYTEMGGRWDAEDATCSLDGNTFKASEKAFNHSGEMPLTGNVLMTDQLKSNKLPEKAKDWDSAKAQIAQAQK
jgi:hypothetical protein